MNKKVKLTGISLLAGLILVSCNFPALLSAQQQDDLDTTVPTLTQTLQASPSETPELNRSQQHKRLLYSLLTGGYSKKGTIPGMRLTACGPIWKALKPLSLLLILRVIG